MAESVAQSFTISATSAEKLRVSKKSARNKRDTDAGRRERQLAGLFSELARVAEMSSVERKLRDRGFRSIAGTDEVGRGCLAGPVVAAAVILDDDPTIFGVNDSKQIRLEDRRRLFCRIVSSARAISIGIVEAPVIDRINILRASKLAMRHAVDSLPSRPDFLLIDAIALEQLEIPQLAIIEGDRRSISVAAASIVAKVYRDLLMESYHETYPEYDFAHNRGYGTESHLEALRRFGTTPLHRKTFSTVTEATLFDT